MSSLPLDSVRDLLVQTANALPAEAWWLVVVVLLILGAAAVIDGFTSKVPDPLIFTGVLIVVATRGFYVSWPSASHHLILGITASLTLWGINQLWYKGFKQDALGMGDAKWTLLAVTCFGITPALFAWGSGACLAILWMGMLRLTRQKITRVYFAPFLFVGLLAGLYLLKIQGVVFTSPLASILRSAGI